jgi:hypothetical protein
MKTMILSTFSSLKHGNDLKPYSLVIVQPFYQMSSRFSKWSPWECHGFKPWHWIRCHG